MTAVTVIVESPLGPLRVSARGGAIVRLIIGDSIQFSRDTTAAGAQGKRGKLYTVTNKTLLARAAAQLGEYFAGERRAFDLPLAPAGGALQQAACRAMGAIPYGETRTYGQLARALGSPPQAVGQACGANPIPILIPCHRVVAADGKLGGFSGGRGVETKLALLRLEGAVLL